MDGGYRQQQEQQAAPPPGLTPQVAGVICRQQPKGRPRGRSWSVPTNSLGLYGCRDQYQTQEVQYHRILRREAGVQFDKWRARAGGQERAEVGLPGKQRVSTHSDSTRGARQQLSNAHNIQSVVAAAGTKR